MVRMPRACFQASVSFTVEKYRTCHGHGNRNLYLFFSGSGRTGKIRGVGKDFPRWANLMVARSQRTRSRVARDVNRRSGWSVPPPYPKYNHTVGVKYNSVAVRSESYKCHH